jgi:hypothetical protein
MLTPIMPQPTTSSRVSRKTAFLTNNAVQGHIIRTCLLKITTNTVYRQANLITERNRMQNIR